MSQLLICQNCAYSPIVEDENTGYVSCPMCGMQSQHIRPEEAEYDENVMGMYVK